MRQRYSNEAKIAEVFLKAVTSFDWNNGTFAALIAYEHPEAQAKVMETIESVINFMAEEYLMGRFDVRNAGAFEKAYQMRCSLIDLQDHVGA